ncbi:MAG: M28 family peptidase [Cytophagales bacterium]|nr:M28 family peptidase [Cytophagales bacterium]
MLQKSIQATFVMLAWVASHFGYAQNDQTLATQTISRAKIEAHIGFLASDELKGRNTPSAEQLVAARYLATQLQSYGAKPLPSLGSYFQPVKFKMQKKSKAKISLSFNGKNFEQSTHLLAIEANNMSANGEMVFLEYGKEEEFAKTDVKGKIVVVKAGFGEGTDARQWFANGRKKHELAARAGATALVELYNNPMLPWRFLVSYLSGDQLVLDKSSNQHAPINIPHLWLNDPDWKEAAELQPRAAYNAKLVIEGMEVVYLQSPNVVAYVEGTDPKLKDEYVVYSAHYDHVGIGRPDALGDSIYNGARDNAVGTVTVLTVAENIAKYPTKRSALFVLFTGEEKGLLGSQWFIENSPLPHKQMVYCFNSDNAGYNSTRIATIIGLERTTAAPLIRKACAAFSLEATDDPAPEQNLFDRSDNVNFAAVGIPAPTFSLGFTAFDDAINKYYHQPSDQPNNLDYDYLQKFFSAYVYASRLIANAKETPFWKPGDKYFEAGKQLYGKN